MYAFLFLCFPEFLLVCTVSVAFSLNESRSSDGVDLKTKRLQVQSLSRLLHCVARYIPEAVAVPEACLL